MIGTREVPQQVERLDRSKVIVVHCHPGSRAMQVAGFLRQKGFSKVRVMDGGISAWSERIDPSVASY